jgi:outer membrane protein OmpA-like peptidoglycan-associated protein
VKITRWIGLSVLATFTAGCGHAPHPGICGAVGALLGGGGGALIGAKNAKGHDGDEAAAGAGIGAVSGLVAGSLLCYAIGYKKEEAPPPPPPPPAAKPAPPPPVKEKIVLRGVNFDFDKAVIRPDAKVILDEAASILGKNPDVAVSVDGYTDSVGTDAYNMKLSQRRADAVKTYLVGKGVSAGRLTPHGFGETNPVASNDTKEGRAMNRRVELKVAD